MRYLGSKANHADEILKIVLAKRQLGQTYVEPFVGGGNVICCVPNEHGPRIGGDVNRYMIALLTALSQGWHPPETVTKKEFEAIKRNPDKYPAELVGFVGSGLTFGSKWMDAYVSIPNRDYANEAMRNCLKDAPGLVGAQFVYKSYDELEIPPRSLIYCDPPYVGTESYTGAVKKIKVGDAFTNEWKAHKFWKWADRMVEAGHTVFVSEYTGPAASNYPSTPVAGRKEAGEHCAVLQRDKTSTSAQIEEAMREVHRLDALADENAVKLAARWQVVWSKNVSMTVDHRNNGTQTRTECLFHRES